MAAIGVICPAYLPPYQKTSSRGHLGISILYPLHSCKCERRPRRESNCWARTLTTSEPNLSTSLLFTILLDGYHPDRITAALQKLYPQMMTKVRFQLAPKPRKAETAQGQSGFVPEATWWVIERSNTWMERCKMVKNFVSLSHAIAKLSLCFIRLMLKRLANQ